MAFSLNQMINVSPNVQIAIYLKDYPSLPYFFFSMMFKSMSFPRTVPNRASNLGKDFSLQSLQFYSCVQFEIRKRLGLLILLNCEAASLTVFTTMCPKEHQISDDLIVEDYCFMIEILLKMEKWTVLIGLYL